MGEVHWHILSPTQNSDATGLPGHADQHSRTLLQGGAVKNAYIFLGGWRTVCLEALEKLGKDASKGFSCRCLTVSLWFLAILWLRYLLALLIVGVPPPMKILVDIGTPGGPSSCLVSWGDCGAGEGFITWYYGCWGTLP